MKTIEVNGVKFNDFGTNNYSDGMRLISVYPMPDGIVEDVLSGKYPHVYLNPSAPCSGEFYGVYGTPEQYEKFYQNQRDSVIARQLMTTVSWDSPQFNKVKAELKANYKDWWE